MTDSQHEVERLSDDDLGDDEGMCACGKTIWNDCDCGAFFEEWICGMDRRGRCSMAGSEDCDFECPVMARSRVRRPASAPLLNDINRKTTPEGK